MAQTAQHAWFPWVTRGTEQGKHGIHAAGGVWVGLGGHSGANGALVVADDGGGMGETATKPLPLPALAQFGNMSREPVVDANHGKEPY